MSFRWKIFKKRVSEIHSEISQQRDCDQQVFAAIAPEQPSQPARPKAMSARRSDFSHHTDYSHYKNTNIKSKRRLRELRWYTSWERRNNAAKEKRKIQPRMKSLPAQHELGETVSFVSHWYSHFPYCGIPTPDYPKTPRMKSFSRKSRPITQKITGLPGTFPPKKKTSSYEYRMSDLVTTPHQEYMDNKQLAVAAIEGVLQNITPTSTPVGWEKLIAS